MLVAKLKSQICDDFDDAKVLMDKLGALALEHGCTVDGTGRYHVCWAQIEEKQTH